MKVLYVTDDNGIQQLLTSLFSLNQTNPKIEAYVYFTEKGADLSKFVRYTEVPKNSELIMTLAGFPDKDNTSNSWLSSSIPKTAYMKVPVLHALNEDILYVDIDTLFCGDISELEDYPEKMAVSSTLNSGEMGHDFNAGVMYFSKGYWSDELYAKYVKAVLDSKGKYGDQETLTRMKLEFGSLPVGYNDRVWTPKTKILQFAGAKPWKKKPSEQTYSDKFYMPNYKRAEAMLQYVEPRK